MEIMLAKKKPLSGGGQKGYKMEIINTIVSFGFLVFLVLLIVAAIKKKPKKPFAIGLAVCFLLGGFTGPKNTNRGASNQRPAKATAETSAVGANSTEEELTELAEKCIANKKVPFSVVLNDGACVVHCEAAGDSAYFNEVDIVRSNLSAYIKFCLGAYETGEVTSVDWWAQTNMIDSKGNESIDKVVQFEMPKETIETYNWENMEYRKGMYSQFSSDCSTCYIHPGILSRIDTDNDIFYAP